VFDQQDWGDFVLSLSRTDGETFGSLRRMASAAGFFVRDADPMSAYHIDLSGGFDAWLGRLGQGVRRQVFNKRSKLETAGGLRWETASASDANAFYEDLDRLHEARWGWAATGGRLGRVYRAFGEALQVPDALQLRRLRAGSRTIAVSRAYRVADRLYDVQSAIDPDFDRSVSPGYLLAGFMVEEACTLGLHTVDLLGGRGREVDYKARLGGDETRLACLQVVRSPLLQAMYRVYLAGRSLLTRAGSG
jgi:CelD/BcsL family acetyltransferase involved in cellulose biosynthesis